MRSVVLRKRQDHDTSLLGSAALALLIAAAALPGQRVAAQAAVPCTAITDDAERLACYDRALRGAAPPAATPQAQPPARAAAPSPAPAAQVPQRNAASTPVAPPASAEPRRERSVRESEAPAAPAAAAAPSAPRAARDEPAEEIIPIVIVSTRALPGREMTFVAEDGTSWVQTDSQRITGLPDTPFDAEIKPGAMGSSFLVAKDRPRAIRVRPVR
jgi:hypothetical protein